VLPDFCSDRYTKLCIYADDTELYRPIFRSEDHCKMIRLAGQNSLASKSISANIDWIVGRSKY